MRYQRASQVALEVKNPQAIAGDIREVDSIPGLGRSPGGGHGNLLQYSCLKNSMDREEPGRLQSTGPQRVRQDWSDLACSIKIGERGQRCPETAGEGAVLCTQKTLVLCLAMRRSWFGQGSQPAKEANETGKSFGSCLRWRCPHGLAGTGSGPLAVAIWSFLSAGGSAALVLAWVASVKLAQPQE